MKIVFSIQILLIFVLATGITFAFKKAFVPSHKYTVTLTESQWGSRMQFISHALVIMRTSETTGKEIAATQDSLIQFQQEISSQVYAQIQADTLVKSKK